MVTVVRPTRSANIPATKLPAMTNQAIYRSGHVGSVSLPLLRQAVLLVYLKGDFRRSGISPGSVSAVKRHPQEAVGPEIKHLRGIVGGVNPVSNHIPGLRFRPRAGVIDKVIAGIKRTPGIRAVLCTSRIL